MMCHIFLTQQQYPINDPCDVDPLRLEVVHQQGDPNCASSWVLIYFTYAYPLIILLISPLVTLLVK